MPKEDVEKYYDENYARVKYIAMELKDADGNSLDDDGKAEIKAMADDYVERANNGENFDDLSLNTANIRLNLLQLMKQMLLKQL